MLTCGRPGLTQSHHQVRGAVSGRRPGRHQQSLLTDKMASLIGQNMVVENQAGAGGLTGIASVTKAEADGYTLAIAPSSGLAMNVNLRGTTVPSAQGSSAHHPDRIGAGKS